MRSAQLDAAPGERARVQARQRVADRERGAHRALGRVLVRDRRAEERHHAVARELVDDALEAVDLAEGELEVLVEEVAVLLGIEAARRSRSSRRGRRRAR